MREMGDFEERKLMAVLEFYLSLDEANVIYEMIFGPNAEQDIETQLRKYRLDNTDYPDF